MILLLANVVTSARGLCSAAPSVSSGLSVGVLDAEPLLNISTRVAGISGTSGVSVVLSAESLSEKPVKTLLGSL